MKVDKAPCWHCRRMFEPWTNERYCSATCHDAAQRSDEDHDTDCPENPGTEKEEES